MFESWWTAVNMAKGNKVCVCVCVQCSWRKGACAVNLHCERIIIIIHLVWAIKHRLRDTKWVSHLILWISWQRCSTFFYLSYVIINWQSNHCAYQFLTVLSFSIPLQCSFLPKFSIHIETKYEDNKGSNDNVSRAHGVMGWVGAYCVGRSDKERGDLSMAFLSISLSVCFIASLFSFRILTDLLASKL